MNANKASIARKTRTPKPTTRSTPTAAAPSASLAHRDLKPDNVSPDAQAAALLDELVADVRRWHERASAAWAAVWSRVPDRGTEADGLCDASDRVELLVETIGAALGAVDAGRGAYEQRVRAARCSPIGPNPGLLVRRVRRSPPLDVRVGSRAQRYPPLRLPG